MSTRKTPRQWSQHVTETSDALDLEGGVFKKRSARAIAQSLKESAEHSARRAMSMLTFYINRAGDNLSNAERKRLENAKDELRELYGRPKAKRN
jgi:hypothetical protein